MAFKFNAILVFNGLNKTAAGLTKTSNAFNRLSRGVRGLSANISPLGPAFRSLSLITAPLAAGFVLATRSAASFDQQMSFVQSKLRVTKGEMAPLIQITKNLGATTVFTSKEVGFAAEQLAQAGFKQNQIIDSLSGVLDAAASSGVGLGEAARAIVSQLGAFGLAADQAIRVADVLALTTATTNTNFTELTESLKFAAPAAKGAGIGLEETAFAVGVLANAGIRGTIAGTAIKNSLLQIAKPTKEATKLFGGPDGLRNALIEFGEDGKKQLKPFEVIMANVALAVNQAKDPLEATAVAASLFGLRGVAAFNAFSQQLGRIIPITEKNLAKIRLGAQRTGDDIEKFLVAKMIPALVASRLELAAADGTAKEMAKTRLDNLIGDFKLLVSVTDNLGIEMGGLFSGPLRDITTKATDFLQVVVLGFQAVTSGIGLTKKQLKSLEGNEFANLLDATKEFAKGFLEGVEEVKITFKETFAEIIEFIKPFVKEQDLTAKNFGKLIAKVITFGVVAAPIFAALALAFFVIGPILSGIAGILGILAFSFIVGGGMITGLIASIPVLIFLAEIALTVIGLIIAGALTVPGLIAIAVVGLSFLIIAFKEEIIDAVFVIEDAFGNAFETVKNVFLNPSIEAFSNLGILLADAITFPLRAVFSVARKIISSIVDLLPDSLLSSVGLSKGRIDHFLSLGQGSETIDKILGFTPFAAARQEQQQNFNQSASINALQSEVPTKLYLPFYFLIQKK